jgi:hypothetical protein
VPVEPIARSVLGVDLSARFPSTTVVGASPAAAAETIIGTLTIANFANIAVVSGIQLSGWAAYTVGTNGTAVQLRIRQTNVAGAVIAATGALTKTAASLYVDDVMGTDAAPGVGVYVLTMIVTAGSATSTVSALSLTAAVV